MATNVRDDQKFIILSACRKKRVRVGGDTTKCICQHQSSIGNLTYNNMVKAFNQYQIDNDYRATSGVKWLVNKWLKSLPNWKLSPDDYENLLFAINCKRSALAVKTRGDNKETKLILEEKAKQSHFDF